MRHRSPIILVLLVAVLGISFGLGWGHTLSLASLHRHLTLLIAFRRTHPLAMALAFFTVYILLTGASVPDAAILTLAGGALFGLWWGTVLVSFASAIGALLAFLLSRFVLRTWVHEHFGARISAIDAGIARDGPFYLFALRLVPVFPFFLVNLAMGLTTMRARTYYWVSQLGMLAGTIVYVNAGTQIARIHSFADLGSPELLWSLTLLGMLPLGAKVILGRMRVHKLYAQWPRPPRFDRNLVVIGAGAAGLVCAYIAAAAKAAVTLVEGQRLGGDCLNSGCVPSKALIHSARFVHQTRMAETFGVCPVEVKVDFTEVMARVRRVIARVAPHDSKARYTDLGVEVLQGHARIISPWCVEIEEAVGKRILTTRAIVIATGATPRVPNIPGLVPGSFLTSDTVWELDALPRRLVILGGGPIGCELAQAFARLGSMVTVIQKSTRLLKREDPDVAQAVAQTLTADGVTLLTDHEAVRVQQEGTRKWVVTEQALGQVEVEFDVLLCAMGRAPRTRGYGLEELELSLRPDGTIDTNAALQTRYPNIYACGDVAGPFQFTHTAAHQAWYAAINAMLGGWWHVKADYSVVPRTIFTDPEVAHVGLSETDAKNKGVAYEKTHYDLAELDRAITEDAAPGFIKVLTKPGKDKILGATIVGPHAGELLAEFVLAMKHGVGLLGILSAIHAYPTWAEANKAVAGQWRRDHVSPTMLAWARRFFAWQRGN
ncbi:MAG: FAD-dependent oxidoreductase [Acidiferrobacter sp.]